MNATTEWKTDFKEISNIIRDSKNQYLVEVEYVDIENPEHPILTMFVVAYVEDGEFFYSCKYDNLMSEQRVLRYAVINS